MGIKERKEREKQRRINDILEAAREVFEGNGFLNTALQDVAKRAEISVGLIYRYFESKEDIFASLALKGAKEFDRDLKEYIKQSLAKKEKASVAMTKIAERFFAYYVPYGDYFDTLLYSYKGMKKEVQISSMTFTRLMSVTLNSLDQLKDYFLECGQLDVKDEDEALEIVFMFWAFMLGCHKLFDQSGRGHLISFTQETFISNMVEKMMSGLAAKH